MDRIRFGRSIHALRVRRGWRQQDLADAADARPQPRSRSGTAGIAASQLGQQRTNETD
jgi:hypothetical protein